MSSRVYRAVTLQSKDVVDLLLRGETYRCDVANFAMLEFMYPSIEGAAFTPTGDAKCEIAGFGVNQLKEV